MNNYKHLFFDLDKTLWDFTENTKETFVDLYNIFNLKEYGVSSPFAFHKAYEIHNDKLWDLYRKGEVEKSFLTKERYIRTLKDFGIFDENLAVEFSKKYIELAPHKTKLIDGTLNVLNYLCEKKYSLHIITNGFNEVQFFKLKNSGLSEFFKTVTTSEDAGYNKPDKRVFIYALQKASAVKSESIMIGDDISVDIMGACEAGIDQVFVNLENKIPKVRATYEIKSLKELMEIF